jgi:hypothetical protein
LPSDRDRFWLERAPSCCVEDDESTKHHREKLNAAPIERATEMANPGSKKIAHGQEPLSLFDSFLIAIFD